MHAVGVCARPQALSNDAHPSSTHARLLADHVVGSAVQGTAAVDEQPGATSLSRVAAARVAGTPHVAAALPCAHRAVLVAQQKARVDADLVAVVAPHHEVSAGGVLPRVAHVVHGPRTVGRVGVRMRRGVEEACGLGTGVDARDAELEHVVYESSVRVWQSDGCRHVVRSRRLEAWRRVVQARQQMWG